MHFNEHSQFCVVKYSESKQMKKILNICSRILWIMFFVIAFVPALIILVVTDIREESRILRMFGKSNAGRYSKKKITSSDQNVSGSLQFVADPV